MAYEVTATRRRPQKFDDLVGQNFVAETLKNTINSGKIAHAYLFTGPRGCGKTSTARILAKALNCKEGPTVTPCGKCSNCLEIAKSSSMDVIEIDGASNNNVDNIRNIKDEILFPPHSSKYKIYIIDEVHMLSTSAFNALLKTIEEPPPYVIFIFATTELQKVPATIKSRCQQFNFRLVPVDMVKEQLALAAQELGIRAEDEALYWIAREAGGSMRDSYTLFDQIAAFSDTEITYDKIRDKLGLVGIERLNELFELCAASKTHEVLTKLDEYLQKGLSIEQLISNCTDYLRSVLLLKCGINKESLLGNSPERYSKTVLNAWNNIQIERGIDLFMQLYRDIRYSISPRYELELALSRMCWLNQYVSPAEVKKAIETIRPLLSNLSAAPNMNEGRPVNPRIPKFSILEETENNSQPGENGHPFPDGGAVPPRFTAEFTPDPVVHKHEYSPEEKESFQQELENNAIASLEEEQLNMGFETAQKSADTESMPEPEKLRAAIDTDFAYKDPSTAGLLINTEDWQIVNNQWTVYTSNNYTIIQLKNNSHKISQFASNVLSRQINFQVQKKELQQDKKLEYPEEILLLQKLFGGQII